MTLGGEGRPVVGRIVVPGLEGMIDWHAAVQSMETFFAPPMELVELRDRLSRFERHLNESESVDPDERIEYERDRARALRLERDYILAQRRYTMMFEEDGRFRVEDVS